MGGCREDGESGEYFGYRHVRFGLRPALPSQAPALPNSSKGTGSEVSAFRDERACTRSTEDAPSLSPRRRRRGGGGGRVGWWPQERFGYRHVRFGLRPYAAEPVPCAAEPVPCAAALPRLCKTEFRMMKRAGVGRYFNIRNSVSKTRRGGLDIRYLPFYLPSVISATSATGSSATSSRPLPASKNRWRVSLSSSSSMRQVTVMVSKPS